MDSWFQGVFPLLSFLIHVVLMIPPCRALVRPEVTLPTLSRLCPWETAKSPLSYTKAGVLPVRWTWSELFGLEVRNHQGKLGRTSLGAQWLKHHLPR